MEKRVNVFISYSPEDQELCKEFEAHLSPLRHSHLINVWHKRAISPGAESKQEIDMYLKTSHLILLLISSDFIASDYCYGNEVKQALERYERGDSRVIPIILRSVYWKNMPFGKLEPLPRGGEAISNGLNKPSRDKAFSKVTEDIAEVVNAIIAEEWQKEGRILFNTGDYQAALKAFDKAIHYNPKFAPAYYDRGTVLLYHLGRYQEALVAYEQALQLGYDAAQVYYDMGNAFQYYLHSLGNAVECYRKAIALKPDFAPAHYDLGTALYSLEDYGNAEKAYRQAIELGFDTDAAYFGLGNALYKLHRFDEASEAYEQAVIRKPQYDDYKRFFADTLSKASRFPGDEHYPVHVAQAIRERYYQADYIAKGLGLPLPVNPDDIEKESRRGTKGYKRSFTNGAIYWSKNGGAQPVWWGIADLYERRHKGPEGIMGFPLTGELRAAPSPQQTEGIYQRFEGEFDYSDNVLRFAVPAGLRYGATAYYSKKYHKAYLVNGAVGECYELLGGTTGKLGFPIGNAVSKGVGPSKRGTEGLYKEFEGGRIYYSRQTGAYAIWDPIASFYYKLNGPNSRLGFPISNEWEETSPQETKGVFQRFEGGLDDGELVEGGIDYSKGVLVCSSEFGTYSVWGGIGICYRRLGEVGGNLGFPISPEIKVGESEKYYQYFEGGIIFYCADYSHEGISVSGSTFALYQELGGIKGRFGFPKSSETTAANNPRMHLQEFEGGVICVVGEDSVH